MNYYLLNDIDGLRIAGAFVFVIIVSFLFGYMVGRDDSPNLKKGKEDVS